MSVAASGYLRIQAKDVNAWMGFGTGVLGLMDAQREDAGGARFLRMDDHPFRLMLEAGDTDQLLASGFEYRTHDDWQRTCDALTESGHQVQLGSDEEAKRRCVTAFASVQDPAGNTSELYYGRGLDYTPLVSPAGITEFVTSYKQTGDLGFGHVVLPTPDIAAAKTFYTDLLGFELSDTLYPPGLDGVEISFMHADNPRQHSLALFSGPHPLGVVHMMVEVGSMDEVGLGLERAKKADAPLLATLGRHINDNMCSFYVLAPGGIAVEYGYDGILVDWNNYTPTVSMEGDLWGHEYSFPGVNDD